jgi:hypothetical protein
MKQIFEVIKSGGYVVGVWKGKQLYAPRNMWSSDSKLRKFGYQLKTMQAMGKTWYLPVKKR